MNDAIMIIIMKNCNDFQEHRCIECMRELEAARDQVSSRLQTSIKHHQNVLLQIVKSMMSYVQDKDCKTIYSKKN